MSETDQRFYFQEISKHFLARRGAPFFLSARDLALVAAWNEAGIPLAVVLEGIDRAFELARKTGRQRGKILSLAYCEGPVLKAFEWARDRRVGGTRTGGAKPEQRAIIKSEIEKFLKRLPLEIAALEDVFRRALRLLDGGDVPAERLEELDAETEGRLWSLASREDRASAESEARSGTGRAAGFDVQETAKIRVVKRLREKYRVPYLSPFYY